MPEPIDELHRAAQRRLAGDLPPPADPAAPQQERLVHEIAVHQIELEMQNEQLRQTQAELEASRDRYAELYERAPVGYLTLQVGGAIVEANRMAAEMLGLPQGHLIGCTFQDFVALEDRPAYARHQASLHTAKHRPPLDVRLEVDGEDLRWVRIEMAAPRPANGTSQWQVALTDITDHVRLREELSRLGAAVASSEDAIVSRDLEGVVLAWNDGAARLFGVAAEDIIGKTMDALVPEDRHEEESQLLRRSMRGESIQQFETERRNVHGTLLPLSITLSAVRDAGDRVVGSALIARDISERRRADTALRVRLRQLDVLSQAGEALILGDESPAVRGRLFERVAAAVGCEMQLNHSIRPVPQGHALALETAHGVTEAQRAQLTTMDPNDTLCGIVAEQGKPLVFNHLHDSALPQARWMRDAGARCYAGFPLIAQQRVRGVVSFISTSQSQLHEGDLQVIQTVCDQVSAMLERAGLLDELHENERSLKRADRAKDDFIATLAHELRNPLAPIRNAVGIMRHADAASTQQLAWCRDIIDRQVVQMTRLLEDLLDVSRVTRNKIDLRRERLELLQAIEQALEATRPSIDARGLRLVLELPGAPIVLYGDLTRLTQVFSNLLNNAAKYTDPGGQITLSVQLVGSKVRVGVRDTGIGIDAEQLPRVFDMFAQLAPARERGGGGLGIGLALTRGLVELHQGTIDAYSAGIGRGSEFVVNLPVVPEEGAASASQPHDEQGLDQRPGRRLLVVDDNADAAQTLSTLLAMYGHEVRAAFSGEEALQVVQDWPPDVAVLDIGLPDLNGYELCRRIRAQPWGGQPLLIACTGWGQREDVDRAYEAGFDFHLVKPVDPQAVLRLLDRPRQGPPGT